MANVRTKSGVNAGLAPDADAIDPQHYRFPLPPSVAEAGAVQPVDITEHLTSNAGKAVEYIARSSRIDGVIKPGTPGQGEATYADIIQDLAKAKWYIEREMVRISNEEAQVGQ